MNQNEQELLRKLGIVVTNLQFKSESSSAQCVEDHLGYDTKNGLITEGSFVIDERQFVPMCRLIKIVDMICESKNPQINEQFNHLVTMLFLTEDKKNG